MRPAPQVLSTPSINELIRSLARLVVADKKALKAGTNLMKVANRFVHKKKSPTGRKIDAKDIKDVTAALAVFKERASKPLRKAISEVQRNLKSGIEGRTLSGPLQAYRQILEEVLIAGISA